MSDQPLREYGHLSGNWRKPCASCGQQYMAHKESVTCEGCATGALARKLAAFLDIPLVAYSPDIVLSLDGERAIIPVSIAMVILRTVGK